MRHRNVLLFEDCNAMENADIGDTFHEGRKEGKKIYLGGTSAI